MRTVFAIFGLALLPTTPALADTLVAARPGVMCSSADALAKLTLPDGSSRAAGPGARPEYITTKQAGGCIDTPLGARVTVLQARQRTSVVTYDANDGRGARTFIVPNIDFPTASAAPAAPAPHRVPAWGDNNYPPLANTFKLLDAVHRQCPKQGWDEHSLSHTEGGPWDRVQDKLSPAQLKSIEREVAAQCEAGMSCPVDITLGMEVQMGRQNDLVRAICSAKAPAEE